MYFKIALGNVKKSFKDYSIYFLTLTLSVCIFYSFNSIESQKALMVLNSSESENIDMMLQLISGVSVFVIIILGSLIVYANNFLIKKRKKEFGIYMSLGMGKGKISKILLIETFLVGLISLVSGLVLGIILSQGLSVFTSKLFEVSMSEYRFIISISAIGKTILYFGIIFILVMLFNTFVISKYKIIDLLTASRKNENIKVKNSFIYLITFILAIVSIIVAYIIVEKTGFKFDTPFYLSIGLGVIGTFLIFFSLAGFGINIIKKSKNLYFKELNIFILKQINSKINTNFISMSIICLMLFLTMGILSTGFSFKDALEKNLKKTTPFDASATMYVNKDDKIKSIKESLENLNFKFNNGEKYVYYNIYKGSEKLSDALEKYVDKKELVSLSKVDVDILEESKYNEIRKLENKDTVNLNDNNVFILSNNENIVNTLNNILKNNNKIKLNNKEFNIENKKVIQDAIHTSGFSDNLFTVVVKDDFVKGLTPTSSCININYDLENREKSEEKFKNLFDKFLKKNEYNYDEVGFIIGYTKDQCYAENKGMTTTLLFVGIYLGIIFLISSMAVLSLQQLSEASDSVDRYKSLKRIGVNDKMINKTIFIQTLIYFTLPLGLAFIHALVGIDVANDFIMMFGKVDIGASAVLTALIFIVVYIGYFYATYTGYKNIVKNS
nr:ABC transporter permease [uncultured Romboutsia sp.]